MFDIEGSARRPPMPAVGRAGLIEALTAFTLAGGEPLTGLDRDSDPL
ncbi:hypothetical protein [Nocardia yunnanensis]|nr:hypothetical protein [Nocardia yunnanensis]